MKNYVINMRCRENGGILKKFLLVLSLVLCTSLLDCGSQATNANNQNNQTQNGKGSSSSTQYEPSSIFLSPK